MTYDTRGRPREDRYGTVVIRFTYDRNGNLARKASFRASDWSLRWAIVYALDKRTRSYSRRLYYATGPDDSLRNRCRQAVLSALRPDESSLCSLDKRGLVSATVEYYGCRLRGFRRMDYDQRGEVIRWTALDASEHVRARALWKRDAKGNVTEAKRQRLSAGEVEAFRYAYTYDAKGNWIQQTSSRVIARPGQPPSKSEWVTRRTIIYYEGK